MVLAVEGVGFCLGWEVAAADDGSVVRGGRYGMAE